MCAKQLLMELGQEDLNNYIEYCGRSSSFRFKKSGQQLVSSSLKTKLGKLKVINSTIFKGQRGHRVLIFFLTNQLLEDLNLQVIVFPESSLSEETMFNLKLPSCVYKEWAKKANEQRVYRRRVYGEKFVARQVNFDPALDWFIMEIFQKFLH